MKYLRFMVVVVCLAGGARMYAGNPAAPQAAQPATTPQLAILDTDIGDDIDDAFALALTLRSPEFKLLGITTTYGHTELRARLLDRYLAAVGRSDIPVAMGPATGQLNPLTQTAYALEQPARHYADAVGFLLDQIRAHPGEITLLAIGPLVNVQTAIARDPETFRKLKRVVMMGGSVYRGYDDKTGARRPPDAEWNIRCDPAGLKALLSAGVPIYMMPLDSTQIHLALPELMSVLAHGSPLADQLTLLYQQWTAAAKKWRTPTLFDPVAITYAIRPELCPAQPMRLEVDEKGFTRPVEGAPNVQVCLRADEEGFRRFLLERLTGEAVH